MTCDSVPERMAIVGTGGVSHGPAPPDSGKINESRDRDCLQCWSRNDKVRLLEYTDQEIYREAGQGRFEIRAFIAISGTTEGLSAKIHYYRPIPIFAAGCTVDLIELGEVA